MELGWLARLYPARLRREHGEEIREFLEARADRARTRGAAARAVAFCSAVLDVIEAHAAEWGRRRKHGRGGEMMGGMLQDLRYAARRLMRTPIFTAGGLAIMAIAIGANSAVFTVVDSVLLRPPPFGDADRVVGVYQDGDDGEPSSTSYPAYRDMTAFDEVFSSVAASTPSDLLLETVDGTERVAVEFATASTMDALGMSVARGRWFDPSMDTPGGGNYAVLGYRTWMDRFAGDPDVIGTTLRLGGQPVEIIGVGPQDYAGVGRVVLTEFWLSISSVGVAGDFMVGNLERRADHWYDVKARLAPGVSVEEARQAMDRLAADLARGFPEFNEGRGIRVFPQADVRIHPSMDGDIRQVSTALMGIVLLVLVLAATNLGSLLLIRGFGRSSEIAVRRALGAGSGRITGLFISESALLTIGGGVLGVLLARWLVALIGGIGLPGPLAGDLDLAVDGRVLAFTFGLIAVTTASFAWAPAMNAIRMKVASALREDQRSATGGRMVVGLRNSLVALQVAVSLVLVVGAGVAVRSLMDLTSVDPGVDVDQLAFFYADFNEVGLDGDAASVAGEELTRRLEALPGVTAVTWASRLPAEARGTTTQIVEDYAPADGTNALELNWASIRPNYFDAMGVDVVEGRVFEEGASFRTRDVVVNEAAARIFWGEGSALGRRLTPQGSPEAWREVIGVVADYPVRSLDEAPTPKIYWAMGETPWPSLYLVVRSDTDPTSLLSAIRTNALEVHPQLQVGRLGALETHYGDQLTAPRASASVMALFSLLALLLASVGIYTIVSFTVAGRMPEIGIRVALGAARGRVVLMVGREVAVTSLLGIVAGVGVLAALGPAVGEIVFGSTLFDPRILLVALGVLSISLAIATWLPARRAAHADPVDALRG